MMYAVVKILVSAIIIGLVTEIAKRFPTYGGIIAALPLVSLLSILWLSIQGEQSVTLNKFIVGVLMGLPATMVLLIIVYFGMKNSLHLLWSVLLGIAGWMLFLAIQDILIKLFKDISIVPKNEVTPKVRYGYFRKLFGNVFSIKMSFEFIIHEFKYSTFGLFR